MKRWKAAAVLALCTVLLLRLTQVQAHPVGESPYVPVLGIVTTAAADDRCEAQSAALVHAAADSGFKVLEMPVERTQEAQIEALRALIIYQVDAIVFTPLVESGWDNVLREAKSASVPLIAVDRSVRGVEGVPLYHIGFDYAGLAERAAAKQLLTCGNSRMSDIAFDVGYQDSHYFSYLFKKHVGVSPREYRSRSEEG